MPALWPTFIPNVTQLLAEQAFTDPGAIQNDPKIVGAGAPEGPGNKPSIPNPNFAVTPYIPLVTPSGRRDFGVALAEEYIAAVNTAQTPLGAMRQSNPAADEIIKLAYGEAFEQLYRAGDLPLMDTKDADGNIIKEGKESHEAFADLCPDPIEIPDLIEEEKKRKKKFNAFLEKYKDDSDMNLHKFTFSEFHCIEDGQPQDEVEKLIATKLIREFEAIPTANGKIDFYDWILRLGSLYYAGNNSNWYYSGFKSSTVGDWPYFNVSQMARTNIGSAGYNWETLVNNVESHVLASINLAYPTYIEYTGTIGNTISDMYKRILRGEKSRMIVPWPYAPGDMDKKECPLSKYKIQVSYTVDDARPKLLTNEVISLFSYTGRKVNWTPDNWDTDQYLKHIYYDKDSSWIETNYEEVEYKIKWNGHPAISGTDTALTLKQKMSTSGAGTIYKSVVQMAIDAKAAADECDLNETSVDIDFDYSASQDPYEKIAAATIAFWYAHLVQPFTPMPAMLPSLTNMPLGGIYVPVYYGSMSRLSKGIRRALNSGKTFDKVPAPQPPSLTVATSLAAVYALHLLEFKLIYLGGIPVPLVPFIPMVGFVPVVF